MYIIAKVFEGQKSERHFIILKEGSWSLEQVTKEAEGMIRRGEQKEVHIFESQGFVRLAPAAAVRSLNLEEKLGGSLG